MLEGLMLTKQTEGFINQSAIQQFDAALTGELIQPGDANYDEARAVWNGMIDRHPKLIVRCADTIDVVNAVNFARAHGLRVAVRGGGHQVAGHGTVDGGLVIDMSLMNRIEVDPDVRIAKVGGGAKWGGVDHKTQLYGLMTPGGVVSDTGVAGLALGGGFGFTSHKFGLACDNIMAAEVVTADGRVVRASEHENADLLWGLRGGGGNFGIVTQFEFRLHELGPEVMMLAAFHDGKHMKEVLQYFRDFCERAPDEISLLAACGIFPPDEAVFPNELHGMPFVLFIGVYAGAPDDGERVVQELRDFNPPLLDLSGRVPYVEAQTFFDPDYPSGARYYWKSLNLSHLNDDAIDTIVEHALRQPSDHSTTDIWHKGAGAVLRNEDGAAFNGRHAPYLINPEANWHHAENDEANVTWVRKFIAAVEPYSDGGRYLNFAGFQEEGDTMMRAAFGEKYERLAQLKRKYDPTNFFGLNQNVKP